MTSQNDLDLSRLSIKERRKFLKGQFKQGEKKDSFPTKAALVIAVLLIILTLGFLWSSVKPTNQSAKPSSGLDQIGNLKLGDLAPDFDLPSTTGSTVSLKSYQGKNVLLYFNEGVMCAPCWQQIGSLQKSIEKFQGVDTEIVAIGVDSRSDWEPILKAEKVESIPVLIDADRSVSAKYGVLGLSSQMHSDRPGHTFVLVDKNGRLLWLADYPTMRVSDEEILASVNEALKKPL